MANQVRLGCLPVDCNQSTAVPVSAGYHPNQPKTLSLIGIRNHGASVTQNTANGAPPLRNLPRSGQACNGGIKAIGARQVQPPQHRRGGAQAPQQCRAASRQPASGARG